MLCCGNFKNATNARCRLAGAIFVFICEYPNALMYAVYVSACASTSACLSISLPLWLRQLLACFFFILIAFVCHFLSHFMKRASDEIVNVIVNLQNETTVYKQRE